LTLQDRASQQLRAITSCRARRAPLGTSSACGPQHYADCVGRFLRALAAHHQVIAALKSSTYARYLELVVREFGLP
jgi:hypothetical protein